MGDRTPRRTRRLGGVAVLEYAVIAALVAVVVIGIIGPLGTNVGTVFATIAAAIEARPFFCGDACAGDPRLRLRDDAALGPRPRAPAVSSPLRPGSS